SVAEPVADIHMPNNSIIPFFMSLGLFIAGLGAIFQMDNAVVGWSLIVIGLLITFVSMFLRSWIDDHGFYIPKSKIEADLKAIREKGD
ncbi:cytochrome ubiquinol oxidase subunit I, partial [Klebsiella pneumoniae]|nr:cytochrome ubiquinol oxidase subunit I [Klebsiella pneumoniae]